MKTKFRNIVTRNLAAEKWSFVVAIACTLIVSVADLLRPWPLKLIVDNILLGKPFVFNKDNIDQFNF